MNLNQRIEQWLQQTRNAFAGDAATRLTHQLRSLHDGILVGIGTVLADDPQLTVREWQGMNPQPIVLDSRLRFPASARLCTGNGKRCWVLTGRHDAVPRSDCELLPVTCNGNGHIDLVTALQLLHQRGIRSLMVEGGASVLTALLKAQLVDAVVVTIAPRIVGGYKAVGELGLSAAQPLPQLSPLHSQQLDDELIVWGNVQFGGAAA